MTTLLQLLIALLTGGFALGGVYLTQRAQRTDKEADRIESRRALLRSKADEIYLEIEAVQARAYAVTNAAGRKLYLPGQCEEPDMDLVPARLDRLKALVNMYFPAGAGILAQWDVDILKPLSNYGQRLKVIQKGNEPLEVRSTKARESELKCAQETQMVTQSAIVKLRLFMNEEVKKLL